MSNFSDWISTRLEQRGMSQTALAAELECSQGRVSEWVRGVAEPDLPRIERICSVLGPYVIGAEGLDEADVADALVAYRRGVPEPCDVCGANHANCPECAEAADCPGCGRLVKPGDDCDCSEASS